MTGPILAGPYSFPRAAVSYEVELTKVVPAWVQDYRSEKLAGMYPARARSIPFLRKIMARGDDVSVELETALGVTRIGGTTELCTFHLGNQGVNGFNNQQSGVRYTLDGMTTFGMIERSAPADLCTLAD